jgi:hypothetical protein
LPLRYQHRDGSDVAERLLTIQKLAEEFERSAKDHYKFEEAKPQGMPGLLAPRKVK